MRRQAKQESCRRHAPARMFSTAFAVTKSFSCLTPMTGRSFRDGTGALRDAVLRVNFLAARGRGAVARCRIGVSNFRTRTLGSGLHAAPTTLPSLQVALWVDFVLDNAAKGAHNTLLLAEGGGRDRRVGSVLGAVHGGLGSHCHILLDPIINVLTSHCCCAACVVAWLTPGERCGVWRVGATGRRPVARKG